jgi:hypothetical protein
MFKALTTLFEVVLRNDSDLVEALVAVVNGLPRKDLHFEIVCSDLSLRVRFPTLRQ